MKVGEALVQWKSEAKAVINDLKKVSKNVKKLGSDTTKFGSKMQKGFKKAAKGMKKFTGATKFLRRALLGLAAGGIFVLIKFLKSSVKAFTKQEQATARLGSSFKFVGGITKKTKDELIEYAGALQRTTTFGDELTISAMAQLGTFGLTSKQVKKLTPNMLDMAAAVEKATGTQADLEDIAKAIGKSFTTGAGALTRYGVTMTKAEMETFRMKDTQGKVAMLQDILNKNYGGTAVASANTYSGAIRQLKNAFGDFEETVGKRVMVTLAKYAKKVQAWLQNPENIKRVEELTNAFMDFAEKGVTAAFDAATKLIGAIENMSPTTKKTIGIIAGLVAGMVILAPILEKLFMVMSWIGGVLKFIGPLISNLPMIIGVITGSMAGMIGIILVVGTALGFLGDWVAGIVEKATGLKTLGNIIGTLIGGPFYLLVHTVKNIIANWDKVIEFFKGLPGKILGFLRNLPGQILGFFSNLPMRMAHLMGFMLGLMAKGIINGAVLIVKGAIALGKGIYNGVKFMLTKLPGKVWGIIKSIPGWIRRGIPALQEAGRKLGRKVVTGMIVFLAKLPGKVSGIIGGIVETIKSWGSKIWEAAKGLAKGFWESFKKELLGSPKTKIEYFLDDMNKNVLKSIDETLGQVERLNLVTTTSKRAKTQIATQPAAAGNQQFTFTFNNPVIKSEEDARRLIEQGLNEVQKRAKLGRRK